MTSIPDVIAAGPTVSFEFFPPKTAEGRRQLDQCIAELAVVEQLDQTFERFEDVHQSPFHTPSGRIWANASSPWRARLAFPSVAFQ